MQIVNVPIADLKASEYNPRKITDKQIEQLTDSIEEFGLIDPLIVNEHVDRKNVVIGGHQRLRVARSLGMTEVPVVYVNLDPAKEKRLNLRLNKNQGEWDWDILANNFDNIDLIDIGFDFVNKMENSNENTTAGCARCADSEREISGHEKRSGHAFVREGSLPKS